MSKFPKIQYFVLLSYGQPILKWVRDLAWKELMEFTETMPINRRFYADNVFTEKMMHNPVYAKWAPYCLSDWVKTGKADQLEFTKGTRGPSKAYRLKPKDQPDKR